jgi:hypothetical protein
MGTVMRLIPGMNQVYFPSFGLSELSMAMLGYTNVVEFRCFVVVMTSLSTHLIRNLRVPCNAFCGSFDLEIDI